MAKLKRPSDPIKLAKLVGDITTEQVKDEVNESPTSDEIRRVMSALGKIGGWKSGKARAAKLSRNQRSKIAKHAAIARWAAIEE